MIAMIWWTLTLALAIPLVGYWLPVWDVAVAAGIAWLLTIGVGSLAARDGTNPCGPVHDIEQALADHRKRKALGSGELSEVDY